MKTKTLNALIAITLVFSGSMAAAGEPSPEKESLEQKLATAKRVRAKKQSTALGVSAAASGTAMMGLLTASYSVQMRALNKYFPGLLESINKASPYDPRKGKLFEILERVKKGESAMLASDLDHLKTPGSIGKYNHLLGLSKSLKALAYVPSIASAVFASRAIWTAFTDDPTELPILDQLTTVPVFNGSLHATKEVEAPQTVSPDSTDSSAKVAR